MNGNAHKLSKPVNPSQYNSQVKDENSQDISTIVSVNYTQFKDKLMNKKIYNSTFRLDEHPITGNIVANYDVLHITVLQNLQF